MGISTEHTNKKLTNNMSDFAPTETTLPSGVDAQAEDNQISEDKITKQDLDQIDESNIVSGERATRVASRTTPRPTTRPTRSSRTELASPSLMPRPRSKRLRTPRPTTPTSYPTGSCSLAF